jgi:hypothetical protein
LFVQVLFVEKLESRFSDPVPLFPGMGKWFKLGSAMMLLWKSSKLIGARNSVVSGGDWLDTFPTLAVRRVRFFVELFVESTEEFSEWK